MYEITQKPSVRKSPEGNESPRKTRKNGQAEKQVYHKCFKFRSRAIKQMK